MHQVLSLRTSEIKKFLPFLKWKQTVTKKTFISDTIAGLVVALILIPQAIAYAQLAGLPPQQGLYAALIAPIVAALFGTSSKLSTGPVAIVSLVTASAFSTLNILDTATMVQYAILLALLVGLIQVSLGVLKLGIIVNFISHPVLLGFSNAAALIIATSQLPKVFGVKVANYDHHYETMYHFLTALPGSFHLLSFVFAIVAILLIMFLKKLHPLTPGVLIVMLLTTVTAWLIHFEQLGGSVVGHIPQGLPHLAIIQIDLNAVPVLVSTALIVSILGFMESISIAKSLALKSGEKIDANQEFIGQGLANITTASVQGYPVAGSFSRSAVNFQAGAQTGISSVITGLCVLLTLLFFTPLLYHLPQSVLSAIIITSVINLINFDKIKQVFTVIRSDGIIAFITFAITLFYAPHLDKGILIGVGLSLAYYVYTRTKPNLVHFTANKAGKIIEIHKKGTKTCKHITILRFDGSLFFANAVYLENQIADILASKHKEVRYIILDAQGINYIDSSGIEAIDTLQKELHESGKEILYVRVKDEIMEKIKKTDTYKKIRHNLYESRTMAVRAIYEKAHTPESTTEEHCPLHTLIKE
jgi:SulP family sulfate permease